MTMTSKCRACGAPLVFAVGPSGKTLPLQRVRVIYALEDERAVKALLVTEGVGGEPEPPELYVSHFETCSDPARFSKR